MSEVPLLVRCYSKNISISAHVNNTSDKIGDKFDMEVTITEIAFKHPYGFLYYSAVSLSLSFGRVINNECMSL